MNAQESKCLLFSDQITGVRKCPQTPLTTETLRAAHTTHSESSTICCYIMIDLILTAVSNYFSPVGLKSGENEIVQWLNMTHTPQISLW